MYERLMGHLFPGDNDEHGAVIAAGLAHINGELQFLARQLHLAQDGIDYLPGKRGYRMLSADFIADKIAYCREERLAYFAIHNHFGQDSVAFSLDDLASHERGYPTLLELSRGMPVGALVFAHKAVAADVWFADGRRKGITEMRVLGREILRLRDRSRQLPESNGALPNYSRQVLMFGAGGQKELKGLRIGVIGAGGVGSLVVEYLARLGVGTLLVADPDVVEVSNLSRIVGATEEDVHAHGGAGRKKIEVAKRLARQANPLIRFEGMAENFARKDIAERFRACDFIFLAADSAQARLVFNALVHQYYIPGIQIGSKVSVQNNKHIIEEAFSVYRWVLPGQGCLWCHGLISRHQLALEAKTDAERRQQAYGTQVANPSVITLNAVGAAHAVNDFLMTWLGIADPETFELYRRFTHVRRSVLLDTGEPDPLCPECGAEKFGRLGLGDAKSLPTIPHT